MTHEMPRTIWAESIDKMHFFESIEDGEGCAYGGFLTKYTNTEALIAELEGMKKEGMWLEIKPTIGKHYNAAIDAVIEKLKQLEKGDGFGTGTATGSGYASGSGYGSGGY